MKHQYFGDVNDYVKYGLLRCFAEAGFRVGICWMLTPEDQKPEGQRTKYLSQPEKWGHHDANLYSLLSRVVPRTNGKHLCHIEAKGAIPNAMFFGDIVPDIKINRSVWYKRALATLNGSEVLFFDPDNGIEVPSKPMGRKESSKYIYWEELQAAWKQNASLLVFQHFPRMKRTEYIPAMVQEMRARLKGSSIVPLRSSNILFLLAHRSSDSSRINNVLKLINSRWTRRVWDHRAT